MVLTIQAAKHWPRPLYQRFAESSNLKKGQWRSKMVRNRGGPLITAFATDLTSTGKQQSDLPPSLAGGEQLLPLPSLLNLSNPCDRFQAVCKLW
jgi:hypothetical protein